MDKELLFVEEELSPYGGGNCVSAWALQVLRKDWNITILTAVKPDFEGMNRHYGTELREDEFKVWKLPFPFTQAKRFDPDPFSVQRQAWMMRFCRRRARRFDLLMSTCDEFDFGRPAIQYTHFPYLGDQVPAMEEADHLPPSRRFTGMITGKIRPWLAISGIRASSLRSNLWLTNSHWTAGRIADSYRTAAEVLYPPVRWTGGSLPWTQKRNRFATLGRISPDKRLLELVAVLEEVRARGHEVGLDIIGDPDNRRDRDYWSEIRRRAEDAGGWIRLHPSVSRDKLEKIVTQCRYGIHGKMEEHFGIAIAEMVRAGCIVFVPDSGGQVEIVGARPGLCYGSDEDAVEKICAVLDDEQVQRRLGAGLREHADQFSESCFMQGLERIVTAYTGENGPGSGRS